jgi:hypothetical protein
MIRGDSIRQTASIARCISVALTANDHITFDPSAQASEQAIVPATLHCVTPRHIANPRLLRLSENHCFASGHGFRACVRTQESLWVVALATT